jgi:hypothetical protein
MPQCRLAGHASASRADGRVGVPGTVPPPGSPRTDHLPLLPRRCSHTIRSPIFYGRVQAHPDSVTRLEVHRVVVRERPIVQIFLIELTCHRRWRQRCARIPCRSGTGDRCRCNEHHRKQQRHGRSSNRAHGSSPLPLSTEPPPPPGPRADTDVPNALAHKLRTTCYKVDSTTWRSARCAC